MQNTDNGCINIVAALSSSDCSYGATRYPPVGLNAWQGPIYLASYYPYNSIKDDPSKVSFGQEIGLKYLEPKSGGLDRELSLRAMAEDGYNLIIGVGFLYSDSLAKVAGDFPDIHFGIIDGWIPDLNESSNITCLGFAEHEGSFLMGAVCGYLNKGGRVGFLGGMDIPFTRSRRSVIKLCN